MGRPNEIEKDERRRTKKCARRKTAAESGGYERHPIACEAGHAHRKRADDDRQRLVGVHDREGAGDPDVRDGRVAGQPAAVVAREFGHHVAQPPVVDDQAAMLPFGQCRIGRLRRLDADAGEGHLLPGLQPHHMARRARGTDLDRVLEHAHHRARAVGCGTHRHQGVVARVEPVALSRSIDDTLDELDELEGNPLLLVLDGITDPHNLGACLRVADDGGNLPSMASPRTYSERLGVGAWR
eukprot:gene14004-18547_t